MCRVSRKRLQHKGMLLVTAIFSLEDLIILANTVITFTVVLLTSFKDLQIKIRKTINYCCFSYVKGRNAD